MSVCGERRTVYFLNIGWQVERDLTRTADLVRFTTSTILTRESSSLLVVIRAQVEMRILGAASFCRPASAVATTFKPLTCTRRRHADGCGRLGGIAKRTPFSIAIGVINCRIKLTTVVINPWHHHSPPRASASPVAGDVSEVRKYGTAAIDNPFEERRVPSAFFFRQNVYIRLELLVAA